MISNLELGKHDECHDMHVRIKLVKTRYMNKLDREIMIEQDLEGYNKIELAIDHFVQARKISLDVNSFQKKKKTRYH